MQSQPYVEVAKVAVYEYATSKCARDAPSRAGGENTTYRLSITEYKIVLKIQNLGNFIKNVGQWDKLPKCGTNVGQNCKMWEMWECGTSVRPDLV